MTMFTIGKSIITLVNIVTTVGPYLADWKYVTYCNLFVCFICFVACEIVCNSSITAQVYNTRPTALLRKTLFTNASYSETHIFNPNWPPHARYHNGQTMSMGLFIGLITFYTLYAIIPRTASPKSQTTHLTWVLLLQNLIYLSSLTGILYPGAAWEDPEFGNKSPQLYGFPILVALCWVGWYIETSRLARVTGKKQK